MIDLQIIGGGRMGEALVAGLLRAGGRRVVDVRIVEPDAARCEALAQIFPGIDLAGTPGEAAGTVIAVKPGDVAGVCRIAGAAGPGRVLSIAAGVTIATVETNLPDGTPVVRAMPNTPALVGLGASAIAPGSDAREEDLRWAEELLGAVGTVVRVEESMLDAVTGLSGSGPAYVFLVAEALIEAGGLCGLPPEVSRALSIQTLLGAATLLARGEQSPEALRAAVTSPGGTTAEGLRVLEDHGLRAAFVEAVAAAAARSGELGRN